MPDTSQVEVLVRVTEVDGGRQIGRTDRTTSLISRMDEVKAGIVVAAQSIAAGLGDLPRVSGWQADEVTVSFGLAFTFESSVIVTKAGGEASLDVNIVYRRVE